MNTGLCCPDSELLSVDRHVRSSGQPIGDHLYNTIARISISAVVAFFLCGAFDASAQSCGFSSPLNAFSLDAGSSGSYAGPFGTVCVTLTSNTVAKVTFNTSDATKYLFIDSNVADLNVNATSFQAGNFSYTQLSGFNAPTPYT